MNYCDKFYEVQYVVKYKSITLCNKDFGALDISTDYIILGVTDT